MIVMKPLHSMWLIDLFNLMTANQKKKVIFNGREVSGISKSIKINLFELPSLDLFKGMSMGQENFDFVINQSFPGKEDLNVSNRKLMMAR